jgi:hypothetical protein
VRDIIAAEIFGLMGKIVQLMLSANIGDIIRYGNYSNHYYSILETQGTSLNMMKKLEIAIQRISLCEM